MQRDAVEAVPRKRKRGLEDILGVLKAGAEIYDHMCNNFERYLQPLPEETETEEESSENEGEEAQPTRVLRQRTSKPSRWKDPDIEVDPPRTRRPSTPSTKEAVNENGTGKAAAADDRSDRSAAAVETSNGYPRRNERQVALPKVEEIEDQDDEEFDEDEDGDPGDCEVFCICQQPDNGEFMVGCDLCDRWFHGRCIGFTAEDEKQCAQWFCLDCRVGQPDLQPNGGKLKPNSKSTRLGTSRQRIRSATSDRKGDGDRRGRE